MTMDPAAAPASGAYRQIVRPAAPARRPVSKVASLIAVAGALALGLAFGLRAKPEAEPVPLSTRTVAIEIAQPAPLPAPKSVGKLEVLPTDLALAANRAAQEAQAAQAAHRLAPRETAAPWDAPPSVIVIPAPGELDEPAEPLAN